MGAEFVRGRVCQGPSLLGAEMSRNPYGSCLASIRLTVLCALHEPNYNLKAIIVAIVV